MTGVVQIVHCPQANAEAIARSDFKKQPGSRAAIALGALAAAESASQTPAFWISPFLRAYRKQMPLVRSQRSDWPPCKFADFSGEASKLLRCRSRGK